MRLAQAHDRDAFETLVERHLGDVHRIAVAIVGPADAMDVTQETFVVAWQQLPRLRNPDAFGGWLRRICVNNARQWLRRTRRRGVVASIDSGDTMRPMEVTDQRPDFRGAVEARAILEPAIERLNPDQRALLALHYTLGFSIAESAEALGIRVGTAKSRLNAGLTALRKAIVTPAVTAEPEAAP
ncbi:MAG: RNA polymerase sigma factor [Candidatus Limnocylindria bacterium]